MLRVLGTAQLPSSERVKDHRWVIRHDSVTVADSTACRHLEVLVDALGMVAALPPRCKSR